MWIFVYRRSEIIFIFGRQKKPLCSTYLPSKHMQYECKYYVEENYESISHFSSFFSTPSIFMQKCKLFVVGIVESKFVVLQEANTTRTTRVYCAAGLRAYNEKWPRNSVFNYVQIPHGAVYIEYTRTHIIFRELFRKTNLSTRNINFHK